MYEIHASVGAVVIGQNEANGLRDTLERTVAEAAHVVYVDSASTDLSVDIARSVGVHVIELDPTTPVSAARARNAGAAWLADLDDPPDFIQFVDGDSVLVDGWIDAALDAFDRNPGHAAVCGWTREAEPRRNVFHAIADIEWKMGDVGIVDEFAGIVMLRSDVVREVGGYDETIVAGEEPEFGARIRAAGYTIERLGIFSSTHDIDMTSPAEWWRRSARAGKSYSLTQGLSDDHSSMYASEIRRSLVWGVVAPIVAIVALPWSRLPIAALGTKYAVSAQRAAQSIPSDRAPLDQRAVWGVSCALSSMPAGIGYLRHRAEHRKSSS